MLSDKQIERLNQPLDPKRIKSRAGGGGRQLSYISGYDAIAVANEIFGFGEWGYDLLECSIHYITDPDGKPYGAYFSARVRLSVRGCLTVTEEGVCAVQEGRNARAAIDAHDMARKGAITDALKRALRCYGDQFGNSLYDPEADHSAPAPVAAPVEDAASRASKALGVPVKPLVDFETKVQLWITQMRNATSYDRLNTVKEEWKVSVPPTHRRFEELKGVYEACYKEIKNISAAEQRAS